MWTLTNCLEQAKYNQILIITRIAFSGLFFMYSNKKGQSNEHKATYRKEKRTH
ncbi:hypothetical protein lbkm_1852 [Lachnospiraceae bacterium KM106-2]|nr:hypothetical protein lbkm_1852 [Lachnospiraceae bacterium KM106-2]